MFQGIPPSRLLIYLLLIGLLPIVLAWFFLSEEIGKIGELENRLYSVSDLALNREKKQSLNMGVRNYFRDVDHFYIDKNLEAISLLDPEVESLKQVRRNSNFPEDENVRKRLDFLTEGNKIAFAEGVVQSSPLFQEVTETLVHPIEINEKDLQNILCNIEGVPIKTCIPPNNRPQLIILDFKLDKKASSDKNEVFLLNLKLLKREFL